MVQINATVLETQLYPCNYILTPDLVRLQRRNVQILGAISIITSLLSIIGSGSIILYAILRRICRSAEVRPLFHLSIADFLLALFWMTGAIINFSSPIKNEVHNAVFCFTWQAVTESVHLMSFFLTVNYAASVYFSVKEKIDRMTRFEYPFMENPHESFYRKWHLSLAYVIACEDYSVCYDVAGLPFYPDIIRTLPIILFIPFGLMISGNQIMACQKCIILLDVPKPKGMTSLWPYYGYIILVFSLCLSIVLILTFYFLTLRIYRRALPCFCTDRQRMLISSMASRVTLYILVFLYCWSPAFIIVATRVDLDRHDDEATHPLVKYFGLYVLQAMSAPLQGLLNSIVYGWTRKAFREASAPEGHRLLVEELPFRYGAADQTPPSSVTNSMEYAISRNSKMR